MSDQDQKIARLKDLQKHMALPTNLDGHGFGAAYPSLYEVEDRHNEEHAQHPWNQHHDEEGL